MKLISFAILLFLHPVHVSLTGIEYEGSDSSYSVFVKVYSDDLEADINLGCANGDMITGDEEEKYHKYLTDRILILEDGRQLDMKLLKAEVDGAEHRFNLKADGTGEVRIVTVVNRIMTRLYDDQANMLLFSFGNVEEGYRFTVADTLRNYNVK